MTPEDKIAVNRAAKAEELADIFREALVKLKISPSRWPLQMAIIRDADWLIAVEEMWRRRGQPRHDIEQPSPETKKLVIDLLRPTPKEGESWPQA